MYVASYTCVNCTYYQLATCISCTVSYIYDASASIEHFSCYVYCTLYRLATKMNIGMHALLRNVHIHIQDGPASIFIYRTRPTQRINIHSTIDMYSMFVQIGKNLLAIRSCIYFARFSRLLRAIGSLVIFNFCSIFIDTYTTGKNFLQKFMGVGMNL